MINLLRLRCFVPLLLVLPLSARGLTVLDAVPDDPILCLHYTRSQIAFEQASQAVVKACAPPLFGVAWILAEAERPEGRYLLLAGPIWDFDEEYSQAKPGKPVLEQNGFGGINLLTPKGTCIGEWDPYNVLGNFFPAHADTFPTAYEAKLAKDLGIDLIRRAERALGGRENFLRAVGATGVSDDEQDPVMIPLLKAVHASAGQGGAAAARQDGS